MLCFSLPVFPRTEIYEEFPGYFLQLQILLTPFFSMKLIHRASSIFAAGLMTSQLHHGAGWHCIKAAAAVISYRADYWWNFLPGSKDVAKPPDIVLSLSPSLYRSVSWIAKKLPAIAI
jgi:hypothetical protein